MMLGALGVGALVAEDGVRVFEFAFGADVSPEEILRELGIQFRVGPRGATQEVLAAVDILRGESVVVCDDRVWSVQRFGTTLCDESVDEFGFVVAIGVGEIGEAAQLAGQVDGRGEVEPEDVAVVGGVWGGRAGVGRGEEDEGCVVDDAVKEVGVVDWFEGCGSGDDSGLCGIMER